MKHLQKIITLALSITVIVIWNDYMRQSKELIECHKEKHDLIIDNNKKDQMIQNAGMDYNDFKNTPEIHVECDKY